jgi:hypothetical protein
MNLSIRVDVVGVNKYKNRGINCTHNPIAFSIEHFEGLIYPILASTISSLSMHRFSAPRM